MGQEVRAKIVKQPNRNSRIGSGAITHSSAECTEQHNAPGELLNSPGDDIFYKRRIETCAEQVLKYLPVIESAQGDQFFSRGRMP
jgi:hypothetical protein